MVLVVVAGGTSPGLGRSIVRALNEHPEHTPVVLSRLSSTVPRWLKEIGCEVRKVDYQSQESLVAALRNVHTIICVFVAMDNTWASAQLSLLQAALTAGVKRFAPPEFGCGPLAFPSIAMVKSQIEVWEACEKAKSDYPGFECAGFEVGLFMNYLGKGSRNEEEALAGNHDNAQFVYYMRDMKAFIPLKPDGTIPRITMTEIGDIGRFVAAACSLPKWERSFGMVGSTMRMDEVVKLIEDVRQRKMDVTFRTPDQIRQEQALATDPNKLFWLELEEIYTRDRVDEAVIRPVLNGLCPDVKPMSIKDYLWKYWADS